MRAVPNMTVLECGDATEVESLLEAAGGVPGPVYARMLRGTVPRLFPAGEPLRVGEPRPLSGGDEVLLISSGICTGEALRATAALGRRGVGLGHIHVSTIKPLGGALLMDALTRCKRGVITLENHGVVGGLGSAVAEIMASEGLGIPLVRLGLQDTYAHGASCAYLLREYGLDALAVARAVGKMVGGSLHLTESDLETAPPAPAGGRQENAEDL